jgi:hypothetical protein
LVGEARPLFQYIRSLINEENAKQQQYLDDRVAQKRQLEYRQNKRPFRGYTTLSDRSMAMLHSC